MADLFPLHPLLLLSDSALPLGSFAFSSGLESHLAHLKHLPTSPTPADASASITRFLQHSLENHASTTLPFLLAAHADPASLAYLDDVLDASTACTVARRASTAQGRALAALWGRALRPASSAADASAPSACDAIPAPSTSAAAAAVDAYLAQQQKQHLHLPPLFGAISAALALQPAATAHVYLLSHARAVLSAAVRAGVVGPYASQALLASALVRGWIEDLVAGGLESMRDGHGVEESAGVAVPAVDLWMGRHELLYSRIFNS